MTGPIKKAAKRMRLGTRSCAECRRRRVRCVMPSGSRACEACMLHDTLCHPQQPPGTETQARSADDSVGLHERLEELEAAVRRWHDTSPPSAPSWSPPASSIDGFATSMPGSNSTRSASALASTSLPDQEDSPLASEHAPLISLIKSAVQLDSAEQKATPSHDTMRRGVQQIMRRVKPLLPHRDSLRSILELTEPYWATWPAYYYGDDPSQRLGLGKTDETTDRLCCALDTSDAASVAKAILWLALCVQQVPLIIDGRSLQLPAPTKVLIDIYRETARTLLDAVTESEQSIVDIECLHFQFKLSINAGNPRQAWLFTRRAMNISFLLNLHHLHYQTSERQKNVWFETWYNDIIFSMVLGMPWSLSFSHPGLRPEFAPAGPGSEIRYAMGKVAYGIIERDQQGQTADYATTMKIDQDWESCWKLLPHSWLSEPSSEDEDFMTVYSQTVTTMYVFTLRKLIHMPYMLNARTDRKYEHSRISASDASRSMIQAYRRLRGTKATERVMCEFMDFLAFSSGIVLAVNQLWEDSISQTADQGKDWDLISSLRETLRRASKIADCPVAAQGARLLEILTLAFYGDSATPARFEATIPYFGKVHLTRKRSGCSDPIPIDPLSSSYVTLPFTADMDLGIEFFQYGSLPSLDIDPDLCLDWTTMFQP